MTAIQALSDHKKKYEVQLEEFSALWVMKLERSTQKWVLAAIFPTKQANSRISCYFLEKTLRATLRIPFYDWIVPKLQSGKLQIQQNLKPKIKPGKLTTKMHLIDL